MTFEYIFNWLWLSSSDPSKVSLTVKGLAVYIVPILVMYMGWDTSTAGSFVTDMATVFATMLTLVGLVRKLYLTWQGENKAL